MSITKTTTKTVTLIPTKTLTKYSNSEVVEMPDSKIVVKYSSARAVYGADTVAKLEEMSTIGLRLDSAESKITQLINFEASNDYTLAQLKTEIESDYQTADTNTINASKTYTDTTVASESQARAVSEAQLKTEYEGLNNTTNSRIDTVETSISDESQARATSIAQLETAYKNADTQLSNSLIQYTDESISTESQARASAISTLTTNYNGLATQLQSIDTTLSTVNGWSASSSKLITAPDGAITGWQFADGSYQDSVFKIYADKFQLSNGTNSDTPFEIDLTSGKTVFKGKVVFTNTDMSAYANSNVDLSDYAKSTEVEQLGTDITEAYESYTNTVKQALIDGEISDAEQNAINTAKNALISASGLVNAYHNADASTITYDENEGAFCLYSSSDTIIGMAYPAFRVDVVNQTFKISISKKASVACTSGFYLGICEYDAELPAGKTHVSNYADISASVVQEDTRTRWLGASNVAISNTWETLSFDYVPTSTAKWASVIILNWSGMATAKLFVRNYICNANTSISWQTEVQNALDNDSTTIDGGKIVTGSISAAQINTNAISGKTISGGVISGTNIYGSYIEGAIIKASFIDLSSTVTLTNWQQYTPITYPSTYDANFAKNNDGTLLVDSDGYVRLSGNTNLLTTAFNENKTNTTTPTTNSVSPFFVDLYSFNDYKHNALNRVITENPILSFLNIDDNHALVAVGGLSLRNDNPRVVNRLNFRLFNNYFECFMDYTIGSSFLTYIKKNGTTLYTYSSSSSPATHTETINIYGIEFTINVGVVPFNMYFMTLRLTRPVNTLSLWNNNSAFLEFTTISCTTYGTSSGTINNNVIVDIPSIEVTG